jgi:hypothetical protein
MKYILKVVFTEREHHMSHSQFQVYIPAAALDGQMMKISPDRLPDTQQEVRREHPSMACQLNLL